MKALLLGLLLSPGARAAETPAECPRGMHRIATNNPYAPFECVKEDRKSGFGAVVGPQGFKARPRCPRGTHATESSDGLQRYKCVRSTSGDADPRLETEPGGEDEPAQKSPAARAPRASAPGPDAYRRYTVPAEMSFDYPKALQPRDGWKEDVPTLSFTLDDGSPGKPVMITITKVDPAQPGYIDLDGAANKDKEWQNAKDAGAVPVAGVKARVTFVSGESKTAYIPLAGGAYYTIVYSAPVEAYDRFLPAFDRLLKTMKITRSGK